MVLFIEMEERKEGRKGSKKYQWKSNEMQPRLHASDEYSVWQRTSVGRDANAMHAV